MSAHAESDRRPSEGADPTCGSLYWAREAWWDQIEPITIWDQWSMARPEIPQRCQDSRRSNTGMQRCSPVVQQMPHFADQTFETIFCWSRHMFLWPFRSNPGAESCAWSFHEVHKAGGTLYRSWGTWETGVQVDCSSKQWNFAEKHIQRISGCNENLSLFEERNFLNKPVRLDTAFSRAARSIFSQHEIEHHLTTEHLTLPVHVNLSNTRATNVLFGALTKGWSKGPQAPPPHSPPGKTSKQTLNGRSFQRQRVLQVFLIWPHRLSVRPPPPGQGQTQTQPPPNDVALLPCPTSDRPSPHPMMWPSCPTPRQTNVGVHKDTRFTEQQSKEKGHPTRCFQFAHQKPPSWISSCLWGSHPVTRSWIRPPQVQRRHHVHKQSNRGLVGSTPMGLIVPSKWKMKASWNICIFHLSATFVGR